MMHYNTVITLHIISLINSGLEWSTIHMSFIYGRKTSIITSCSRVIKILFKKLGIFQRSLSLFLLSLALNLCHAGRVFPQNPLSNLSSLSSVSLNPLLLIRRICLYLDAVKIQPYLLVYVYSAVISYLLLNTEHWSPEMNEASPWKEQSATRKKKKNPDVKPLGTEGC